MLRNDQLDQWDHDHFFHPSTHLGQFARGEIANRIVTGGDGVYINDRDRDPICGEHYGQRPCPVPHEQAEHMAAPTSSAISVKSLDSKEPSTHGT